MQVVKFVVPDHNYKKLVITVLAVILTCIALGQSYYITYLKIPHKEVELLEENLELRKQLHEAEMKFTDAQLRLGASYKRVLARLVNQLDLGISPKSAAALLLSNLDKMSKAQALESLRE